MDEDELDRLRDLAQQNLGTVCAGPIYPSEVLALVEEIDRLCQVIVLMDRELEQAQAALIDGSPRHCPQCAVDTDTHNHAAHIDGPGCGP